MLWGLTGDFHVEYEASHLKTGQSTFQSKVAVIAQVWMGKSLMQLMSTVHDQQCWAKEEMIEEQAWK